MATYESTAPENFTSNDQSSDFDESGSGNPFQVEYLASLDTRSTSRGPTTSRAGDLLAGSSLDIPPINQPPADAGAGRNNFQIQRGQDGQISQINFQGGMELRRAGNDWQLYRNNQAVTNAAELQEFSKNNALGLPLSVKDGKIQGKIEQKPNGDITYDARGTEANTFATRFADGRRDIRNFNDYSRTTYDANGRPDKTYWDGYQWRHGSEQRREDGSLQVTFDANERRPQGSNQPWPRGMIRDGKTDQLTVQHDNNTSMTANWREQSLVTTVNGQRDVRYFDGQNWRHGQIKPEERNSGPNRPNENPNDRSHMRRIEFSDGDGPGAVIVDTRTGEIKERIPRNQGHPPPRPTPTPPRRYYPIPPQGG